MRIIISGGKTGGHLIPGIALYEEALSRGHDVFYFLGPNDDRFSITNRIHPQHRRIVEIGSLSRKLSWKTPLWILRILRAFFATKKEIRKLKPDVVVITGGYISNPVALSAIVLGIPLYILEQNTVAGITNRFFAPFARKVFTSFPHTEKIPPKKALFTGNPTIFNQPLPRKQAREFFNLPSESLCVGIVGGSQGARRLNEAILSLLPCFASRNIACVWSVGASDYRRLQENGTLASLESNYPLVRIYPFIERMDAFWGACDAVIARSGATTIAEVLSSSCPALFIPIYRSPDDHQKKNALSLVNDGGACMVEEPNLDQLLTVVEELLSSLPAKREALRQRFLLQSSSPQKLILTTIENNLKGGKP